MHISALRYKFFDLAGVRPCAHTFLLISHSYRHSFRDLTFNMQKGIIKPSLKKEVLHFESSARIFDRGAYLESHAVFRLAGLFG